MARHTREKMAVDVSVPRRRFLVLALVIVACVVASHLYIRSVGRSFDYRLDEFSGVTVTPESISFSPEGMAEATEVYYDGDTPVARIEARSIAKGLGSVNTETSGMMFVVEVKPGMVLVTDEANFTGWEMVGWSLVICFGVACAICVWNTLWLWKRSWYGYEMAANASLALFSAIQTGIFLTTMLSDTTKQMSNLAFTIIYVADRYVLLTLVPMAVVALLVSLSNVALIRHEGRSLTNLLGIAASLAWAGACLFLREMSNREFETYMGFLISLGINSLVATIITFGVSLLIGTSLCAWLAARHTPSRPRDYLMILGCGLRNDGSPTPLLAGRVDAARSYAQAQVDAGMDAPTFVPSGGQGSDERWAEAESMRRYLLEHGVKEARILKEDKSTNTRENFTYSAERIKADWADGAREPRVAFATTNYHVFRSYVYAHEAGLAAEGIAAPTKNYFWPNAFLREFVGLIAARPLQLALAFAAAVAVYGMAESIIILG